MPKSFTQIVLAVRHQPSASLTEGFVANGITSNCKLKLSKVDKAVIHKPNDLSIQLL